MTAPAPIVDAAEIPGGIGTPQHTGRPVVLPGRLASRFAGVVRLWPGVVLVAAIAAAATLLGGQAPVIGAPVIAIVTGIIVALVRRPAARLRPGISFVGKRVLQGSVVVLGTGLSLREVATVGVRSLPVLLGTLVLALVVAYFVGRALKLHRDATTLIGVGTAICGASAIAASNAVIDAEEADVSYAIATIFTFNVVAVLLYPTIGHALGLSQRGFGLWAGTAINDLSSVVAAASIYGHIAAANGVIVKLTRTLAIIPITLFLAARHRRTTRLHAPGEVAKRPLHKIFPLFILAFLAAVALNSAGGVPVAWHRGLGDLATWMITAALAAIGLSTDAGAIRRAGLRPLALGAVLWATVGVSSLTLQAATGWH